MMECELALVPSAIELWRFSHALTTLMPIMTSDTIIIYLTLARFGHYQECSSPTRLVLSGVNVTHVSHVLQINQQACSRTIQSQSMITETTQNASRSGLLICANHWSAVRPIANQLDLPESHYHPPPLPPGVSNRDGTFPMPFRRHLPCVAISSDQARARDIC